jgi:DNA uptake protein ComE-like DNA-binding protein
MSRLVFGIVSFFAVAASAKPAIAPATAATPVASEGVNSPQLRVVGRLNINTATRDELLKVPGLDAKIAAEILWARANAPITDVAMVAGLSGEARVHLKVDGASNFTRILQNPLQTLADRK